MTLSISPAPSVVRQARRPLPRASSRTGQASLPSTTRAQQPGPVGARSEVTPSERSKGATGRNELGRYLDLDGRPRQVVALPGAQGSVLVIDCDAGTLRDCRLVAHLAADEPPENGALVCEHYLRDATGHWCRRVTPEDLQRAPFDQAEEEQDVEAQAAPSAGALTDRQGRTYRLELGPAEPVPQLRWCRRSAVAEGERPEPVSMREAIAGLESYEPVRRLTHRALAVHCDDEKVSTARLHADCERLEMSQIVLNRGLRRAALTIAATQDVSMSEIAVRCGKVKQDRNGKESGETSWLARRLGLAPESGKSTPTPWIHTDVLALIARHGLGISPREVELG